jgi:hypothetical protein
MAKKQSQKQLDSLISFAKPSDTQSAEPSRRVLVTLYPDDIERLDDLAIALTDGNRSMLVRKLLREESDRQA